MRRRLEQRKTEVILLKYSFQIFYNAAHWLCKSESNILRGLSLTWRVNTTHPWCSIMAFHSKPSTPFPAEMTNMCFTDKTAVPDLEEPLSAWLGLDNRCFLFNSFFSVHFPLTIMGVLFKHHIVNNHHRKGPN